MGFGMMAPKGKAPVQAGKPSQTKGGQRAVPPTNDKMPGAKQAAEYTKKPAPSNAGIPSVKALPPKGKGKAPAGKGKMPMPFMKKGAK